MMPAQIFVDVTRQNGDLIINILAGTRGIKIRLTVEDAARLVDSLEAELNAR